MTETLQTLDKIEMVACPRCGGCGQYSYCQMYGTTCFQCHGKGQVMSKRGRLANAFIVELRTKPARDLAVGDIIVAGGVTMGGAVYDYKARVTFVGYREEGSKWLDPKTGEWRPYLVIEHTAKFRGGRIENGAIGTFEGSPVQTYPAGDLSRETYAAGIAYQAAMNAAGKVLIGTVRSELEKLALTGKNSETAVGAARDAAVWLADRKRDNSQAGAIVKAMIKARCLSTIR